MAEPQLRPGRRHGPERQPSIDDLDTPLSATTFVVVDLETTGGSGEDAITEIGAVKVRGGEVLGEFQTLVNPATHIPALIAVLTGITNQMVAGSPKMASVLPSFLEFAGDAVLVAHNAPFDIGFLKRACTEHGHPWPGNRTLDTVSLARHVLLRDEVPNCKLATLARHFHTGTEPNHRALSDARATVDVLHGLIERVGNLGVASYEELIEFTRKVSPQRRAKRQWAAALPEQPGVYLFHNRDTTSTDPTDVAGSTASGQVLYVGKSTNLRRRVRSYFTAAERRSRIDEMVRVATGVDTVICSTPLEAEVVELRMIERHNPRYNRRSKAPRKLHWLKVTIEPYPRLSVVRKVADDRATYFGPFRNTDSAQQVVMALHDAFGIRQCTDRLSVRTPGTACALAGMGRCPAPCDHSITVDDYGAIVDSLRDCLTGDVRPVLVAVQARLRKLIAQERFEEATTVRTRLEAWTASAQRFHRMQALAGCPQIVAARRAESGWEIHVVRHGKLAGAALARPGEAPQQVARVAVSLAETVPMPTGPLPAGTVEESMRIADWLEQPGVRLLEIDGDWAWPLHAALAPGQLARHALGTAS